MADVNKLLPDVGNIDLGSTAYTENDSLQDITNKYTDLGNTINSLGNAAAEDVHQRQVKLIGNDFGPVNPTMYGAYYQPSINSAESNMRVQGTQKALEEGMDRGKKAAEANYNAAKSAYNNAMDAYSNAKQAFSQLVTATVPSDLLPDGTTTDDVAQFEQYRNNPSILKNEMLNKFTDQYNLNWDIPEIRQKATEKTKSTYAYDENNHDKYWSDPDVSMLWRKTYYDEYAKKYLSQDRYEQWQVAYNDAENYVNGVADWIQNKREDLPTFVDNTKNLLTYAEDGIKQGIQSGIDYLNKKVEENIKNISFNDFIEEREKTYGAKKAAEELIETLKNSPAEVYNEEFKQKYQETLDNVKSFLRINLVDSNGKSFVDKYKNLLDDIGAEKGRYYAEKPNLKHYTNGVPDEELEKQADEKAKSIIKQLQGISEVTIVSDPEREAWAEKQAKDTVNRLQDEQRIKEGIAAIDKNVQYFADEFQKFKENFDVSKTLQAIGDTVENAWNDYQASREAKEAQEAIEKAKAEDENQRNLVVFGDNMRVLFGKTSDYSKDMLNTVFNNDGLTITEAAWLDKWRDDKPEEFESYANQVSAMYGFANTMEVADGERWYYVNGEYQQVKKGTPVFFTYPGAVTKDGKYNDKNLEEYVGLWKDYYSTDVTKISDEELTKKEEALNNAYQKYMKNVSFVSYAQSVFKVANTGELSAAALACRDGVANSKATIAGKAVKDWIADFRSITNNSKDAATKALYELVNRANSNTGSVMVYQYNDKNPDESGIAQTNLNFDGGSSMGNQSRVQWMGGTFAQDGFSNNLTTEQAAALYSVITQSMMDHNNNKNTDLNIDPSFLKQDVHNLMFNEAVDAFAGGIKMAESLLAVAGSGIGAIFGSGENPLEANFMGIEGRNFENQFLALFNGTQEIPDTGLPADSFQRKKALEDSSRRITEQLVNPLLTDIYFPKEGEDGDENSKKIKGIGSDYSPESNTYMYWRNAIAGFLANAGEMAVEAAAGAAVVGVAKGIGKAGATAAGKVVGRMSNASFKAAAKALTKIDDVSNVLSKSASKIDDLYKVTSKYVSKVDDVTKAATGSAKAVAGKIDDATRAASAGVGRYDDIVRGSRDIITKYTDAAADTAKVLSRNMDDMYGIVSSNAAHALASFVNDDDPLRMIEKFNKFINNANRNIETIDAAGKILNATMEVGGKTVKVANAVQAVNANRVLSIATVAASSGRAVDEVASLGRRELKFLTKALEAITKNPNEFSGATAKASRGINKFLKTMGPQDYKNLVGAVLERASINASLNKPWDIYDTYRALASAGWKHSGLRALARDWMKEAIKNPFIDLRRNLQQPQLDAEGNFRVQTLGEYVTNPETYAQNFVFDAITFGMGRIKAAAGSPYYRHKASKAWEAYDAINNSGNRSGKAAAKAFNKAMQYSNKAQQYADKAWHNGGSWDNIEKNLAISNKAIDASIEQVFKANNWTVDYNNKTYDFKSKEDFYKFIDSEKMSPQQGMYVLCDGMLLKGANSYFSIKAGIGAGVREWGDAPAEIQRRILRVMYDEGLKAKAELNGNGKSKLENLHESYKRMKAAALDANDKGAFGLKIRNFEKSLDFFYRTLETAAREGYEKGDLKDIEIGYLPISSLTFEGSFQDMRASHKNGATRGLMLKGSENIDVSAANPGVRREKLSMQMILDAWDAGKKEIELMDSDGNVTRTLLLDSIGLDPVDMLTTYTNNYNIHKYVDPIFGDNRMNPGEAALRNGNAYIRGDFDAISEAGKRELVDLQAKVYGSVDKKTGKYTGGIWDKVLNLAKEQGKITKTEYDRAMKNKGKRYFDSDLTAKAEEKATKITTRQTEINKKLADDNRIVKDGGKSQFMFQTVAKAFNIKSENGKSSIDIAKNIVADGKRNLDILLEAYSTGKLSEDNYGKGFRVEYEYKDKQGKKHVQYKNIPVDDTLLETLSYAHKNGINLDTVYTVSVYSDMAPLMEDNVASPLAQKGHKKVVDHAIISEGYIKKSFDSDAFQPTAQGTAKTVIVDVNGYPINIGRMEASYAKGYIMNLAESSNLFDGYIPDEKELMASIEAAISAANDSEAPQKGSQSLTEGVSGKDAANDTISKANKRIIESLGIGEAIVGKDYSTLHIGKDAEGKPVKYNLPELLQATYNLKRSEVGDIITDGSESKLNKLTDLTRHILYKNMGVEGNANKGWVPSKHDPRAEIVSGILSRLKVELGDSVDNGSFTGTMWFDKLDAMLPDADLLKIWTANDIPVSKNANMSLGFFVKELQGDMSVDYFRNHLSKLIVETNAGKFDDILPKGYTRTEFAEMLTDAKEILDYGKDYNNRPKGMEQLSDTRPGSDSDDADVDYMERYNASENADQSEDIAEKYIRESEGDFENDISNSMQSTYDNFVDTDKERMKKRLEALSTVAKIYYSKDSQFNQIIHNKKIDELHAAKTDTVNLNNEAFAFLNKAGKLLYEQGTNKEYNKLVDQELADLKARTPEGKKVESSNIYAYALGAVSQGQAVNYIKDSSRYNAASMAKAEGTPDEGGWSKKRTDLSLQAGTHIGYTDQLLDACMTYAEFAGVTKVDASTGEKTITNNNLKKVYDTLKDNRSALASIIDENAQTFDANGKKKDVSIFGEDRGAFEDNLQNSIIALLGDVKDPSNAQYFDAVGYKNEYLAAEKDIRKIVSTTLGESATESTYNELRDALEIMDNAKDSAAVKTYYDLLNKAYDDYYLGLEHKYFAMSRADFESEFINSFQEMDEAVALSEHYRGLLEEQPDRLTPSEITGKKSLLPTELVRAEVGTYDKNKHKIHENQNFEIFGINSKTGENFSKKFEVVEDFGSGTEFSERSKSVAILDENGVYKTPEEFYNSLKKPESKEQFIQRMIELNDKQDSYRTIPVSEYNIDLTENGYHEQAKKLGVSVEDIKAKEQDNIVDSISDRKTRERIKKTDRSKWVSEINAYVETLKGTRKIVVEEMEEARKLGDLKENAEYSDARDRLKAIDEEIAKLEGGHETKQNPLYGDILSHVGNEYLVVDKAPDAIEYTSGEPSSQVGEDYNYFTKRVNKMRLSDRQIRDMLLSEYADATKDRSPAKEVADAKERIEKASKETQKLEAESDKLSRENTQETIDRYKLAQEVLTPYEYQELLSYERKIKDIKAGMEKAKADGFYHSSEGYVIDSNKHAIRAGYTQVAAYLDLLGYDVDKFIGDLDKVQLTEAEVKEEMKKFKKQQRQVNKNLRKGNAKYANVEDIKIPDILDIKSRTMTINNFLSFVDQVRKQTGNPNLSAKDIAISKEYADLLFRVSREGIGGPNAKEKIKKVVLEVNEWNKFIQDTQLAGGASWVNALSIAQLRGAIFSDPKALPQYISLCTDFKDDAAVARFAVENSKRLVDIAMAVGDTSIFTDLTAAASSRPGYNDSGQFSAAVDSTIRAFKDHKEAIANGMSEYGYFKESVINGMDAFFSDATFKRVMPVLRAKMIIRNFDTAERMLKKKFPNITARELNVAASQFAYAKTAAFFEPRKTAGGLFSSKTIQDVMANVATEKQRNLLAGWIGMKDTPSIWQMGGNIFFALNYKNRMLQSILQGARSWVSPKEWGQRIKNIGKKYDAAGTINIYESKALNSVGTQFMQRGNRNQVLSLAILAAAAYMSAKALGLSTPWDDLNFEDEENTDEHDNPKFKVPEILTKFQTIGQIWVPNSGSLDFSKGIDWGNSVFGMSVDPNKNTFNLDTMSSLFTLPNTAWKTYDRMRAPQAYYKAPQRGLPFLGVNSPINQFLNTSPMRAIGDELIGSNLLSPYKALYEVLMDSTYYGNNIWEKKYLKDGSVNKHYDPWRNVHASFAHILGLDRMLSPRGYNDYVKGYFEPGYVAQDQMGTVAGSGIIQHEYATAIINFFDGNALEGIIEGGELPIKKTKFSSKARTEFNTSVKNAIVQYYKEYMDVVNNTTDVDAKDAAYVKAVKKSADAVTAWSNKYNFVFGKDQKYVPYATRAMMALLAGEYDDNLDYIQNTYWKASAIAQIEATGPDGYWLDDEDVQSWIDAGKTAEDFAAEKTKRHNAYNQALDDEYKARKALHDAGIDNEYLAGMTEQNIRAEQRKINKEVYNGALQKMKSPVGEFKNFGEMKKYYEAQIAAAGSTKQKAKLARTYNDYVTDALAPYIDKYGEGIIADGYYNNEYLSNALAEYIIIPADEYYSGKTPRANYLKDLFGVGYRKTQNIPSDKEVIEGYEAARRQMQKGFVASSISILDRMINDIKKGRMYASDRDYSNLVRMKAYLNSKSN